MEDTPLLKPPKSECPDIWARPQYKWPVTMQNIEEPVVPPQRDLYGQTQAEQLGNSNGLSGTGVALPERGRVELVASFQGWSTAPKLPDPHAPRWRLRATLLFLVQEWKGREGGGGGSGRARALNCRRQAEVTTGNPKIDVQSYRVTGLPWAPCVSQKPGMPPFGPLFWSEWPLFGRVRGSKFRCGSLIASPFLGLGLPFLGVKKTSKCEHTKIK